MTNKYKGPQEQITFDMLDEFELGPEEEAKMKAWATFGLIKSGIAPERAYYLFRVTAEEIAPYKDEWEIMQQQPPSPNIL